MIRTAAPLAVAAITAVLFLLQPAGFPPSFWVVEKAVPAVCLASVAFQNTSALGRLIGAGLLFSAVGDVVLEIPADLFVPGLLAFLTAHLFYVAAWLADDRAPKLFVALPFYAYGIGMLVYLHDGLGDLFVPVAVYVAVICTMLWRAWARVSKDSDWTVLAGAVGVIVFAISDSAIALNKFHAPTPHADLFIMVTYWLGQAGITAATANISAANLTADGTPRSR